MGHYASEKGSSDGFTVMTNESAAAGVTIPEVVDELERYISLLSESIMDTQKRLQAVLRTPRPTDNSTRITMPEGGSKDSPDSGLSPRLQRLTREVSLMRSELLDTLARVDL